MITLEEFDFANQQIEEVFDELGMTENQWITYKYAINLVLQYQVQEIGKENQVERTKDN